MYKILYKNENDIPEKKKFISPQVPPNNLKKIKEIYSFTDKDIADLINVQPGFVSGVVNNRAIFSGITTLKLLKELNISFSTLYGMKTTLSTNCESFKESISIIELETKYLNDNDLNIITSEVIYNDDDVTIPTTIRFELDKTNNRLALNTKKVPRLLSESETNFILYSLAELNENISLDKNKVYYLFYYVTKSFTNNEIEIDTEKALDVEINNQLFSMPFKKFINITIPASDYELDLNKIILKNQFNIIRNNRLINTNILYENEYNFLSDGKGILFKAFSSDNSVNKLKVYRYLKGYDMHFMANALNLSVESYRVLEVGHNRPTTHQMWKIENKLGIQLENILDIDAYIENFSK